MSNDIVRDVFPIYNQFEARIEHIKAEAKKHIDEAEGVKKMLIVLLQIAYISKYGKNASCDHQAFEELMEKKKEDDAKQVAKHQQQQKLQQLMGHITPDVVKQVVEALGVSGLEAVATSSTPHIVHPATPSQPDVSMGTPAQNGANVSAVENDDPNL